MVSLGITFALLLPELTTLTLQFIPRKTNSMTYNAIVALQARIPAQLNRTWTQDPAIFEDALGRVTPFHLEFIDSWEVCTMSLQCVAI